ncbi:MAG: carbohydrate-binding domain-containing protein [Coriobacteriales bacterium]|nr:carbohydrate-binding domain-containing protein [Coriobacteriales bacterium]
MKKTYAKTMSAAMLAAVLGLGLVGCGSGSTQSNQSGAEPTEAAANAFVVDQDESTATNVSAGETYTDRDLEQTADLSGATTYTVEDGKDITITEEGVYVLSGSATGATVIVDADSNAKVQLVLDGVSIQNETAPAIYVRSADKVFVTTTSGSTNSLSVSGTFAADGETNVDGVIFSKDDLVLNGQGTLSVTSSDNGIVSKDDLKVTGGTYSVSCDGDALQANDGVYVSGGSLELVAASDGVQGDARVQIDGGTLSITAAEGIESTYVQINDGTVAISASDDGINATNKSTEVTETPTIEIAGGTVTIGMGSGDTDALDANGNLIISGGKVDITAQFAFDFDGTAELTGGEVYVNGEQVTTIENSMMMGGGGMGGGPMGGGQGGPMGNMEPPAAG